MAGAGAFDLPVERGQLVDDGLPDGNPAAVKSEPDETRTDRRDEVEPIVSNEGPKYLILGTDDVSFITAAERGGQREHRRAWDEFGDRRVTGGFGDEPLDRVVGRVVHAMLSVLESDRGGHSDPPAVVFRRVEDSVPDPEENGTESNNRDRCVGPGRLEHVFTESSGLVLQREESPGRQ